MPVYGFKDKKTAEKLREMIEGPVTSPPGMMAGSRVFRQNRPIVFENTESVTMPAYACLFSTGVETDESGGGWKVPIHQGKRANTTDSMPYMVMLNQPRDVEAGDRGSAQQDEFQIALYNSTAPTDIGAPLGPADGQWYLVENPIFVTHRFVADLEDGIMLVRESKPSDFFRVVMSNTSGDNGGSTSGNTYQYSVSTPEGILLEAGLMVNRDSRHDYWTWERGEVDPATSGTAYFDNQGRLIIHDCNEHLRLGECSEP